MFINEECEKYTFLSLAAHVEYCTAYKIVIYGLLIFNTYSVYSCEKQVRTYMHLIILVEFFPCLTTTFLSSPLSRKKSNFFDEYLFSANISYSIYSNDYSQLSERLSD